MSSANVLLLVVDSLRANTLVSDDTTTPVFDDLFEEGVWFSNCISQGISTAPAMTAMLTGRYPLDYGGHWYLEAGQTTFAEQFRNGGYTTAAVHSNPYVSKRRNFDRGFDRFEENVVAFEPDRKLERAPEKLYRLASRLHRIVSKTPYTPAPKVNDHVYSLVDDAEEPWFLWAQYMDVHGPYLGGRRTYPKKVRAELLWRKAAVRSPDEITEAEHQQLYEDYCGEVEYLDTHLGQLFDTLEARGELSETIVILTADHGDEFYEHGRYGHGNLPYSELTHVPLLVRFPPDAGIESGPVDDLVRSVDILPTILDYVDIDLDSAMAERCEGRSLLPATKGESVASPFVLTEKRVRDTDALRIGFRERDWSFLYDGTSGEVELYDLREDPDEQTDVKTDNPETVTRFEERLETRLSRIEQTSAEITIPDRSTDAVVEERLKALGYRD